MSKTGRCLCGAVKITLSGDHNEVGACHCSMCRRWGGGPGMVLEAGKDVEITGAEHVTNYRSSDWAERGFCKECGTNLYYRLVEPGDHFVYVGLFDDQADMVLSTQVFIDEKPAFYTFANETKNLTGAELFAMFAPSGERD